MAPEELSEACREALRRQAQWYEAHIAELQLTSVDEEREKYRRLRRAYNQAVGLGLNVEERYERTQRQADNLRERLQFFERMGARLTRSYVVKLRRGRGIWGTPEQRREVIEDYRKYMRRPGSTKKRAIEEVGFGWRTIEKWPEWKE